MAINFPDSPTSGDTHTVGDKTWTWNGTSWDVVVSTPISNQIIDADGDTRIHVEESPDEDYIRFDTAGTERMTIGPTGDVAVANDLSVTGTISGGSTSFPTSLDSGTMPAIEALQAKVGADSSAVTSSHDYLIADHASRLTTLEGASGGKILQVVTTFFQGDFSTSSTSFVDATGHSVTITPSSASSKILVFYDAYIYHSTAGGTREINLLRDSTTINQPSAGTNPASAQTYLSAYENGRTGFHHLDSPATTSAVTYKIQVKTDRGTVRLGTDASGGVLRTPTNFTVMEVAA